MGTQGSSARAVQHLPPLPSALPTPRPTSTPSLPRIARNIPVPAGFEIRSYRTYSEATTSADLAVCDNSGLSMLAAMAPGDNSTLLLAAVIPSRIILAAKDCSGALADLNSNLQEYAYGAAYGAYFYHCRGQSIGFSPSPTVYLNGAGDVFCSSFPDAGGGYGGGTPEQCGENLRLSWHIDVNAGNWRAGSVTSLNAPGGSTIMKAVLCSPTISNPACDGQPGSGANCNTNSRTASPIYFSSTPSKTKTRWRPVTKSRSMTRTRKRKA